MAEYPSVGDPGTWGTDLRAFAAVTTDLSTGKIKNEALQTASTAPIADEALTNKKYVDDSTDGDSPTFNDSDSNAMLKSHAYLTQTSGFVTSYQDGTSQTLFAYVGDTDDPEGAGLLIATSQADIVNSNPCLSFFIAKGKYFEIIKASGDPTITWTPLTVGGGNPIDQD